MFRRRHTLLGGSQLASNKRLKVDNPFSNINWGQTWKDITQFTNDAVDFIALVGNNINATASKPSIQKLLDETEGRSGFEDVLGDINHFRKGLEEGREIFNDVNEMGYAIVDGRVVDPATSTPIETPYVPYIGDLPPNPYPNFEYVEQVIDLAPPAIEANNAPAIDQQLAVNPELPGPGNVPPVPGIPPPPPPPPAPVPVEGYQPPALPPVGLPAAPAAPAAAVVINDQLQISQAELLAQIAKLKSKDGRVIPAMPVLPIVPPAAIQAAAQPQGPIKPSQAAFAKPPQMALSQDVLNAQRAKLKSNPNRKAHHHNVSMDPHRKAQASLADLVNSKVVNRRVGSQMDMDDPFRLDDDDFGENAPY